MIDMTVSSLHKWNSFVSTGVFDGIHIDSLVKGTLSCTKKLLLSYCIVLYCIVISSKSNMILKLKLNLSITAPCWGTHRLQQLDLSQSLEHQTLPSSYLLALLKKIVLPPSVSIFRSLISNDSPAPSSRWSRSSITGLLQNLHLN